MGRGDARVRAVRERVSEREADVDMGGSHGVEGVRLRAGHRAVWTRSVDELGLVEHPGLVGEGWLGPVEAEG